MKNQSMKNQAMKHNENYLHDSGTKRRVRQETI